MSDYTIGAWDLAVRLYEASDRIGIPLHERDVTIRHAWLKTAQRSITVCKAQAETPNAVI